MSASECRQCGKTGVRLKRGWTMALYCSEHCELSGVAAVHDSMPGGPSPYALWVPDHIRREIRDRWEDPR